MSSKKQKSAIGAYVLQSIILLLGFVISTIVSILSGIYKIFGEHLTYSDILFPICFAVYFFVSYVITTFKYFLTTFHQENDSIIIEKRFFAAKKVVLPYSKINTINTKQTLFQRIFGFKTLMLDSGSVATSLDFEFKITLNRQYCDVLESYVQKAVDANKNGKNTEDEFPLEEQMKIAYLDISEDTVFMKFGKLFKASLMQNYYGLVLVLFPILTATFKRFALFDNATFGTAFLNALFWFAISVIACFVFGSIFFIVRYFNFHIFDDKDNIKISCGAFSVKSYTLPKNRINSICIRQNMVQKLFKRYAIEVNVVGYGGSIEENQKCFLYPCATKTELDAIVKRYVPQFSKEIQKICPAKKSLRYFFSMPAIGAIIATIGISSQLFFEVNNLAYKIAVVGILVIAWCFLIIDRVLAYKTHRLGADDEIVSITRGGLNQKTLIAYRDRVQATSLCTTVFRKRKNIYSIRLYVKANAGNTIYTSNCYDKAQLDKINILKS